MGADTPGNWYGETVATFGDRLTAAREARGLTQTELASRLGVRTRTISQWENDMSEPRANRLHMLSGLLGVSFGWLWTGNGNGISEPDGAEPAESSSDATAILRDIQLVHRQIQDLAGKLQRLEARMRAEVGRELS